MTPEQAYNQERAFDAIAALDHLSRAWKDRLTSSELVAMGHIEAALQRAAAEDVLP